MTRRVMGLAILAAVAFALPAYANVMNETAQVCFTDTDQDGFSETLTMDPQQHQILNAYPDDPLNDFNGFDQGCQLPKSYAEYPTLSLTGEVLYSTDPQVDPCMNGELELEKEEYEDGYKLFLLDSATCQYRMAMEMDVIICMAQLQNWCPVSKFAFEFTNAEIDNFIGSPLLDYYAAQPETPWSWASVTMTSTETADFGASIQIGEEFCADAEIAQFPGEECDGCDDCGIESNGRMMTQLAKRHYLRGQAAVCSDPSGEGVLCDRPMMLASTDMASSKLNLATLLPDYEALGLQAVPTSPSDLIDITNANDVIAMDHFKDGVVSGAILLVESEDKVYEHTKIICDRFAGQVLELVTDVRVNDWTFPIAVLADLNEDKRSFAVSFAVADNTVFARWLVQDYPELQGRTVYNIQLWSCSLAETVRLLKAELARLDAVFGSVANGDAPFSSRTPEAYFMAAEKRGTDTLYMLAGRDRNDLKVEVSYYPETGDGNPHFTTLDVPAETGRIQDSLPPFFDAMADLVKPDGTVVDTVYIADGAFAAFDDTEFGGSSLLSSTVNQGCQRDSDTRPGDFVITGCAQSQGMVDKYGVIVRVMEGPAAPYDFSDYQAISFSYRSDTELVLCMESKRLYGQSQSCINLPPTDGLKKTWIPLDQFRIYGTADDPAVLDDIVAFSWNIWNMDTIMGGPLASDFAVEGVTMRASSTPAVDYNFVSELAKPETFVGCQNSDTPSALAGLLLLVLLAALRFCRKESVR